MTIRIVYATLAAVFPHVETWQTMGSDLLFVCSREPLEYDIEKLQVTTAAEPYRTALETVWGVKGVEGLLSRFVASAELARVIASEETGLNTDDLMTIEFAFARTVGASGGFSIEHIRDMGALRGLSRPQVTNGEVDWRLVEEQRLSLYSTVPRRLPQNAARLLHPNRRSLVTAHNLFVQGRLPSAWEALQRIDREPIGLQELRIAAIGAVMARDPADEQWIEALDEIQPTEALIIRARRAVMREEHELAVGLLVDAFTRSRTDPWTSQQLLRVALRDATSLAASSEDHALRLYDSLTASFAAGLLDDARKQSLLEIGAVLERTDPSRCVEILALFEPNVPWSFEHLMNRVACYQANSHPLLERAEVDADRFLSRISMPFDLGALREPSPQQPIFDEMSMSPVGPASADQGMRDSE